MALWARSAQPVRHSVFSIKTLCLAGMPGSLGDASRAANAALESDVSDTISANDSKIVLDAPLWRHWPGSLLFGLRLFLSVCLPACLPSLDQCLSILHAGNGMQWGLNASSCPPASPTSSWTQSWLGVHLVAYARFACLQRESRYWGQLMATTASFCTVS